jgi:hypothetical protein
MGDGRWEMGGGGRGAGRAVHLCPASCSVLSVTLCFELFVLPPLRSLKKDRPQPALATAPCLLTLRN